jgi:hypothetical protein
VTVVERSAVGVEFDVPASWIRVELDHPETWRYLSDQMAESLATLRDGGKYVDASHLGLQMERLCKNLLNSGVMALAARALVAVEEGVGVLITGMVTIALTAAYPAISNIEQLRDAWSGRRDTEIRVVSLPCGLALRVDLIVKGPGLLKPEPLPYRHTRYLVPVFDGRAVAIMVCATPLSHVECFDLVFDQIAQSLRAGDGS